MAQKVITRNGTKEEWFISNPILDEGEQGYESDTELYKFGDGVTPWNSLKYFDTFIYYTDGGVLTEDFETAEQIFPYSGTDWVRTTNFYKNGTYSLYSGSANNLNPLIFTLKVPVDGKLGFWYKAVKQSEYNSTYVFKLDDINIISSASSVDWTYFEIDITSGNHTLIIYAGNNPGWNSELWIDDLSIPAARTYHQGIGEHKDMPLLLDGPNKLLKVNSAGTAVEFIDIPILIQKKSISYYIDDILEVGPNQMSIIIPQDMTIKDIRFVVDTAPVGSSIIIDINKNNTTLYTTQLNRPTMAINTTSTTVALPDIVDLALGDKLTLDIDQIGSTTAGENLSVTIICEVV